MAARKMWKTVAEPTMTERPFTSEKLATAHLDKLELKVAQGQITRMDCVHTLFSTDKGSTWQLWETRDLRTVRLSPLASSINPGGTSRTQLKPAPKASASFALEEQLRATVTPANLVDA